MATRQEIQVAWDLIKFINIINDLLDTSVPLVRGQIKITDNLTKEGRDMTVDEIKNALKQVCQNIYRYKKVILNFLDISKNNQLAINGLAAWGINLDNTKKELLDMLMVTDYLNTEVEKAVTLDKFKKLADYIDINVPKLPLIRKTK